MTTLTHSSTTLTLSDDLYWSDENSWAPVQQTVERSITGALVIDVGAMTKGRPITLEPEDSNSGAIRRATLDTLREWAAVPGRQMTLTLRGVSYTVIFRHQDGAISDRPFVHYGDVDSEDWYLVTLRFMEV